MNEWYLIFAETEEGAYATLFCFYFIDFLFKAVEELIAKRFQDITTKDLYVWRILYWIIPLVGYLFVFYRGFNDFTFWLFKEWNHFKNLDEK